MLVKYPLKALSYLLFLGLFIIQTLSLPVLAYASPTGDGPSDECSGAFSDPNKPSEPPKAQSPQSNAAKALAQKQLWSWRGRHFQRAYWSYQIGKAAKAAGDYTLIRPILGSFLAYTTPIIDSLRRIKSDPHFRVHRLLTEPLFTRGSQYAIATYVGKAVAKFVDTGASAFGLETFGQFEYWNSLIFEFLVPMNIDLVARNELSEFRKQHPGNKTSLSYFWPTMMFAALSGGAPLIYGQVAGSEAATTYGIASLFYAAPAGFAYYLTRKWISPVLGSPGVRPLEAFYLRSKVLSRDLMFEVELHRLQMMLFSVTTPGNNLAIFEANQVAEEKYRTDITEYENALQGITNPQKRSEIEKLKHQAETYLAALENQEKTHKEENDRAQSIQNILNDLAKKHQEILVLAMQESSTKDLGELRDQLNEKKAEAILIFEKLFEKHVRNTGRNPAIGHSHLDRLFATLIEKRHRLQYEVGNLQANQSTDGPLSTSAIQSKKDLDAVLQEIRGLMNDIIVFSKKEMKSIHRSEKNQTTSIPFALIGSTEGLSIEKRTARDGRVLALQDLVAESRHNRTSLPNLNITLGMTPDGNSASLLSRGLRGTARYVKGALFATVLASLFFTSREYTIGSLNVEDEGKLLRHLAIELRKATSEPENGSAIFFSDEELASATAEARALIAQVKADIPDQATPPVTNWMASSIADHASFVEKANVSAVSTIVSESFRIDSTTLQSQPLLSTYDPSTFFGTRVSQVVPLPTQGVLEKLRSGDSINAMAESGNSYAESNYLGGTPQQFDTQVLYRDWGLSESRHWEVLNTQQNSNDTWITWHVTASTPTQLGTVQQDTILGGNGMIVLDRVDDTHTRVTSYRFYQLQPSFVDTVTHAGIPGVSWTRRNEIENTFLRADQQLIHFLTARPR